MLNRFFRWRRARRNAAMRRWAERHLLEAHDSIQRRLDSAEQQLAEALAKLRVMEVENHEMSAVIARNHARVQRETAIESAGQALAENGMALLKPGGAQSQALAK